jgi:hypothetical protein
VQVAADGVVPMVLAERPGELTGRGEPRFRAAHHRDRDGPAQRDHGSRRDLGKQLVQREDLGPVGVRDAVRLVVHGRDRGLQLVRAERPARGEGLLDQVGAFGDQLPVPAAPVLVSKRDESAVWRGSRRAAGVGEQHEREQPGGLRVAGQQPAQHPGQPEALGCQVGALQLLAGRGRVALVEDQVQHLLHGPDPVVAVGRVRRREPCARGADLLLGTADPLRHRRLGHPERPRDLRRGQPADGAQRERDLRGRAQRRVAAEE